MIEILKPSKTLILSIKELTGENPKIDVYKEWGCYKINVCISGKKFRAESIDLSVCEYRLTEQIRIHLTSKAEKDKQNAICDITLFKAMLMEDVYCNLASSSRKELAKLRVMEANEPSDLPRNIARKNKEVLLREAMKLKESAAEFDSKKMRLITKVFESINGEQAIEAKAMCVDYVVGAIELFMKHSAEDGTVVYPAISVKKPKCITFKTVIDKPKEKIKEQKPDYEPLRKQLVELIEKKENESENPNYNEK